MLIAPLPLNEDLRLADLMSYDILDTESEKEFDELVELAASICNCPMSMMSLIDSDRQWLKAKVGLDATETSRDDAFCSHTILSDKLMVVPDAALDTRFADNPFVLNNPNVRFYAGSPIVSPSGHILGAVCVLDNKPRNLSESQLRSLEIISNQITKMLELRAKNKMIKKRAAKLIEIKDNSLDRMIIDNEAQKKYIADQLHENLAQGLAAARLYVGMAEENEKMRMPLLKKAKQHMGDILVDMRNLSNSIVPSTLYTMPLQDMLTDFIKELTPKLAFKLQLVMAGTINITGNEENIAFFRVIESWLTLLSGRTDISKVLITLGAGESIALTIEDDGAPQSKDLLENDKLTDLIDRQINRLGGIVTFTSNVKKGNLLYVSFPNLGEKISA